MLTELNFGNMIEFYTVTYPMLLNLFAAEYNYLFVPTMPFSLYLNKETFCIVEFKFDIQILDMTQSCIFA